MDQDTCAALSAVFPIVLLTTAVEHHRLIQGIRRYRRVFDWIIDYGMIFGLLGLIMSIIGVHADGFDSVLSFFVWLLFGVSMLVVLLMLVGIIEQDREARAVALKLADDEHERQSIEAEEAQRRLNVWWRRLLVKSSETSLSSEAR